MARQRGRVVLLKFWTLACASCRRSLPYVSQWSERFGAYGLVVVGIHTPETPGEREISRVKNACVELGITYPVALDADFAIWNRYQVFGWPTFVLIDKTGKIVLRRAGEGNYARMELQIQRLLAAGHA